ncbi:hypothetical protein Tco_0206654, partial [Tanacetum coccineum]
LATQVAEKTVRTLDILHGHAGNLGVQNRTRKEMQRKITGVSSQSAVLTTYRQELMVLSYVGEMEENARLDLSVCEGYGVRMHSDNTKVSNGGEVLESVIG